MKYLCLLVVGAMMFRGEVSAQSSAISYQGNLLNNGDLASGPFDFTFTLFNAGTNGTQVGATVTNLDVEVTNGLFLTMMDFGTNAFLGSNRWVTVSVRTNGSTGAFLPLSPRQPVTPAPYALYALRAGSGLVGPTGPAGTNGAAGTTGQNATTVYGASTLTVSSSTSTLIPGLYQSLTVPTNCMVYVTTDGGFYTTSVAATGFSWVDVYIVIDGQIPDTGGYTTLPSLNTSGVTGSAGHWALSKAVSLTPVTHTFAVYADLASGSDAVVSGGDDTSDQGELTVMFLKQ